MSYQHKDLAAGRWSQLSFLEQMANIGSEVERALNWRLKNNTAYCQLAAERALELVISSDQDLHKRKECMKSILARRDRLRVVEGDVADWIREGREERDRGLWPVRS